MFVFRSQQRNSCAPPADLCVSVRLSTPFLLYGSRNSNRSGSRSMRLLLRPRLMQRLRPAEVMAPSPSEVPPGHQRNEVRTKQFIMATTRMLSCVMLSRCSGAGVAAGAGAGAKACSCDRDCCCVCDPKHCRLHIHPRRGCDSCVPMWVLRLVFWARVKAWRGRGWPCVPCHTWGRSATMTYMRAIAGEAPPANQPRPRVVYTH